MKLIRASEPPVDFRSIDEPSSTNLVQFKPSLVCFFNSERKYITSCGTGFIVDSAGLVLTAHHVYNQWQRDQRSGQVIGIKFQDRVTLNNDSHVKALADDPDLDYTLLQFPELRGINPLRLKTLPLKPAKRFNILGFPDPIPSLDLKPFSCAVAPAKTTKPLKTDHYLPHLHALHARIWSGFSGGPVIDQGGSARALTLRADLSFTKSDLAWVLPLALIPELR